MQKMLILVQDIMIPCYEDIIIYFYTGEYDQAEIHNAGQLRSHMIHVCIHLAWQMVSFFMYLYTGQLPFKS